MKDKELIAQLEKENAALKEQVTGLTKRVGELDAAKKPSKSREQAEKGLELLKAGPATVAQFKVLNDKYPSDVAYYIRNLMKVDVRTVRTAAGTVYMLKEQFDTYQAGLAAEKEQAKVAGAEAKELLPPPQTSTEVRAAA